MTQLHGQARLCVLVSVAGCCVAVIIDIVVVWDCGVVVVDVDVDVVVVFVGCGFVAVDG